MDRFDCKIQFIVSSTEYDESGFPVELENVAYSCFANRKVLSSTKEFLMNNTTNQKVVVSFKVRNCKFIREVNSLSYQIKYKSELYNIIQVDNSSLNFVFLKCEKVN